MTSMFRRRSRLAPPPWRVFEALVDELTSWWVTVEGERPPRVLASERAHSVTYSSACLERPDDSVQFGLQLDDDRYGCALITQVETSQSFAALEASTLRHRWGEHLDRDLRDWLDDGYPVRAYRVSPYRSDVADWGTLGQLEMGQLWHVVEALWVRVLAGSRPGGGREAVLERGAAVWTLGRKRTAVHCLGQQPDRPTTQADTRELSERPWYEGQELVIPFAEFGKRVVTAPDRDDL